MHIYPENVKITALEHSIATDVISLGCGGKWETNEDDIQII